MAALFFQDDDVRRKHLGTLENWLVTSTTINRAAFARYEGSMDPEQSIPKPGSICEECFDAPAYVARQMPWGEGEPYITIDGTIFMRRPEESPLVARRLPLWTQPSPKKAARNLPSRPWPRLRREGF